MIKTYLLISILILPNANITFSGRQFQTKEACEKMSTQYDVCYELNFPATDYGTYIFKNNIDFTVGEE